MYYSKLICFIQQIKFSIIGIKLQSNKKKTVNRKQKTLKITSARIKLELWKCGYDRLRKKSNAKFHSYSASISLPSYKVT